jgi:hypothetical protein
MGPTLIYSGTRVVVLPVRPEESKLQDLRSGVRVAQILATAQDAEMAIMGKDFHICAMRLPKALSRLS